MRRLTLIDDHVIVEAAVSAEDPAENTLSWHSGNQPKTPQKEGKIGPEPTSKFTNVEANFSGKKSPAGIAVVEVKATEKKDFIHENHLLAYLRLTGFRLAQVYLIFHEI